MGKRNKEPQVGRRRPMIQLGGSSQKSGIGAVSRNALKEVEKENKEKETVPDEIEDQLAGFLAEINSLDDGSSSSTPPTKVDTATNDVNKVKPLYDVDTFDPVTQAHLLPENWQAIYDEGSAYYYYWNTVTNEVQWYPPLPPIVQAPPPPPPAEEENTKQEKKSPSGQNGFHKQVEKTDMLSKDIDNTSHENHVDNINANEDIVNHISPKSNDDKFIKDDDIVTSYLFDSEKDNDRAPSPGITQQNDSVIAETSTTMKKDKNMLEGSLTESLTVGVVDKYAEVEKTVKVISEVTSASPDVLKDNSKKENDVDPYSIIEPFKEKSIDKVMPKEKEVEKVVVEEKKVEKVLKEDKHKRAEVVTEEADSKDKDKELMSKIKEKIQRKKEEKLRKEKEEAALKKKADEELLQATKTKEEMLREKLIKKKYEREKALTVQEVGKPADESSEDPQGNVTGKNEESFSVDMFATEETYEKKVSSGTSTPQRNEIPFEKTLIKEDESKNVEIKKTDTPKDVVDENSTKEKGGWRIIDAVYDEDDDDEDEDSDNAEEMKKNEDVLSDKGKGEMDDYAEMLLEETIVDKDKEKDKKVRVKSKKRKSKQSFIPAPPLEAPPPPPPEPENPPLPPEDEPAPQPPPEAPSDEHGNLKEEIQSLSSTLFEKLNILRITRGEIGKLQQCLIELETRMQDWMAGALESKYFLDRVKEVDTEILKHETAPAGWISHWSSNFKMYYYYNAATGTSQWDYPSIIQPLPSQPLQPAFPEYQFQPALALPTPELPIISSEGEPVEMEVPASLFAAPPPPPPPEISSTQVTVPASAASLVSPAHGFSRDPIPEKTVKSRKRTVPQENEKSADPYRDPYRLSKKKKEAQPMQSTSESLSDEGHQLSGADSGTGSPLAVITSGPVMRETAPDVKQDPTLQSYVNMTPPPPPSGNETIEAVNSPKQDSPAPSVAKPKGKKKKKVEGLAPLKKLKHVSSLVQKWQTVKQQVEDEENVEEESDEDYETASERRISDWKKEMENSDAKVFNPNFTEIKGDWRARLKRKTAT